MGTDDEGAIAGSRARWRSTDIARLRAVKYEDTETGRPPLPVVSAGQHTAPGHPSTNIDSQRPTTAPSVREFASNTRRRQLSNELKRDSGIAASTNASESTAEPRSPTINHTPPSVPAVPTILVNDATPAPQSPTTPSKRPRSPFAKRKGNDQVRKVKSYDAPSLQRIRSFRAIDTQIPSGGLGDFASEEIVFTKRGSLLFGGQKMNSIIEAQGSGSAEANGEAVPISVQIPHTGPANIVPVDDVKDELKGPTESPGVVLVNIAPGADVPDSLPRSGGLVAGRRKPSVQMLQAAIHGGRILSAEEISFSMRVRSMYEHGDENAATWCVQDANAAAETTSLAPSTPVLGASSGPTTVNGSPLSTGPPSAKSQSIRASYAKAPHELAGGMEDWEDVEHSAVDRFGFIVLKAPSSRGSDGHVRSFDGIHRVATGLRLAADKPRRERSMLRRGPSFARSSHSAPAPHDPSSSVNSLHSNKSGSIRRSGFRSRGIRIVDEAGNMLMLPPGLSDIAEQREGGDKSLSHSHRKQSERDSKWQAMARPRQNTSKSAGGGMAFDFDTSNSKVIDRTWKGIPDRWRATAWHSFLATSAKRRGAHDSDETLIAEFHRLQTCNCADDVQIDVDVPRTISMHIMFRRRYRGGQRLLFRVLHAIALYRPETGYVQGMASLAATLLCYYDEERAFVMLARLWQLRGLEQLFQTGFEGLMAALKEFEDEWLRGGDVALRLQELGIDGTAYGTRWYLTLFNMSVPFPAQLRIWDVFMLLGDASPNAKNIGKYGGADLDVLHATSAALIDATREIILDSDFEGAMKVLTSFVPIRDEDLLMRVARAEWKMRKKRA